MAAQPCITIIGTGLVGASLGMAILTSRGKDIEVLGHDRDHAQAKLARTPFKTDLGERIQNEICTNCWQEWLQHQTLLINHYGLDPRDKKAKAFLYEQIEQVLLQGGEGAPDPSPGDGPCDTRGGAGPPVGCQPGGPGWGPAEPCCGGIAVVKPPTC